MYARKNIHFMFVKKTRTWNNELRKYEYEFKNPEWKKAQELDNNHYFGMKINENISYLSLVLIKI